MFDGRWRHAVDRSTKPVGIALARVGVTADVLTIFGLLMSVAAAFVIGSGHLLLAIGMLFASGLPDLFDGPVAKVSGTASVRGAFFDSVADRVSDALWFGGVAYYLEARHHGTMVLLPFAVLAVTSMVSYQRAKADLLGISATGGLMERAERFILLGTVFLAGAVAPKAFVPALWAFFGLVCITAIGRFVSVWRAAEGPVRLERPQTARRAETARRRAERPQRVSLRWQQARSDSRWRAWLEARMASRDMRSDARIARGSSEGFRPLFQRRVTESLERLRSPRQSAWIRSRQQGAERRRSERHAPRRDSTHGI